MTDCRWVRERLAEHALGILASADRPLVDAHLAWCAGCRKEARELAEGAAVVGASVPGVEPPAELAARVARGVAHRPPPRRSRGPLVAALVAAMLAVGAFGWAVAMTGRAERMAAAAQSAAERAERFEEVVAELLLDAGEGRVLSADLRAIRGRAGGGRAVVFDSPGGVDWALVVAGGLPEGPGPYRAVLEGGGRRRVGRLQPSSAGELAAYRYFDRDVSSAGGVTVRDAEGRAVLRGALGA